MYLYCTVTWCREQILDSFCWTKHRNWPKLLRHVQCISFRVLCPTFAFYPFFTHLVLFSRISSSHISLVSKVLSHHHMPLHLSRRHVGQHMQHWPGVTKLQACTDASLAQCTCHWAVEHVCNCSMQQCKAWSSRTMPGGIMCLDHKAITMHDAVYKL